MPSKKSKSKPRRQATKEQRAAVGLLRRKGLYNPKKKGRKEPTEHALKLVRLFSDVISGRASVVTVAPAKEKGKRKQKGFKEAASLAEGAKAGDKGGIRARGNKVIISTRPGEHARYAPKKHELTITEKIGSVSYKRKKLRKRIRSADNISDLEQNEIYSIPMLRSGRRIEYQNFSADDMREFWRKYGPGSAREFKGLGRQFFILSVHVETPTLDEELFIDDYLDDEENPFL